MKLKDKVAIITGGASGIGRATSLLFGKEGAKVVVADVNEKGGQETVRLIKAAGGEAFFVKTDVSKEEDARRLVELTIEKYGRLDILVNNAGVVLVQPFEEITEEQFDRVVNVNLKGIFLVSKYGVQQMKKQREGVIVNMGSVSAHASQVDHAVYGATKGGIISMTRAMAVEFAPYNIRVNSISPGSVDTPMLRGDLRIEAERTKKDFEELRKEREREGVLSRWAKPEEIASCILFLASDDSSYITGADLRVDGGWTAK